jgi:hypothetical protein
MYTNLRGENLLKLIKWLFIVTLLILVAGSSSLFSKVHIATNGDTFQDKAALNKVNILIVAPNLSAKINPVIAILDAVKTYHPRVFNLSKITVEYQMMTASAGGHSLSMKPVYIVSFVSNKGWSGPSGGPIGNDNPLPLNHEFNTVVDARTGETLFSFSYR